MPNNVKNMQVTKAGYKYVGHYRTGYLQIILETDHCGVSVYPIKDEFNMYRLFECFDICPEDGVFLEDIVGKYCRVTFDENNKVAMIQHITRDISWIVDTK